MSRTRHVRRKRPAKARSRARLVLPPRLIAEALEADFEPSSVRARRAVNQHG